jgi:hypothetical protein
MKTTREKKPAIHARVKPVEHRKPAAKKAAAPAKKPSKKASRARPAVVIARAAPPVVAPPVLPALSPAPLAVAPATATGISSSYANVVVQAPAYDPASGLSAFNALAPNRAALTKVQVAHVDIQAGAMVALGAYAFVMQVPALCAQFQKLAAAGLFLMPTLSNLKTASFAAVYAFNQAEVAGAYATNATVPAAIISEASAVEKRMQARCEYVFANDPTVRPLLDMLRPGTGYNDLANDLLGYASIYESKKSQIATTNDPNYLPTDLADAKSYAGQILSYLTASMNPKAKAAYDQLQQSWTLLLSIYAEVQAAGLWLLRFDPQRATRFPSLTTMARATATRKKKTATAPAPIATAPTASSTTAPQPIAATPTVSTAARVP